MNIVTNNRFIKAFYGNIPSNINECIETLKVDEIIVDNDKQQIMYILPLKNESLANEITNASITAQDNINITLVSVDNLYENEDATRRVTVFDFIPLKETTDA